MSEPMTLEQASHNLRMYANTDCDADGVPILLACADAIDVAIAERDALRERIGSAPSGEVVRAGDDEAGQPRVIVHSTREELAGCATNLIGKRVRIVKEVE